MSEVLDACRVAAGTPAELVWVDTPTLLAAGVDPWMGVPLWIAEPGWSAANRVDGGRARAAGLVTRPIIETVTDVLAWDMARGGPAPGTDPFPPDQEERLLSAALPAPR